MPDGFIMKIADPHLFGPASGRLITTLARTGIGRDADSPHEGPSTARMENLTGGGVR